MAIVTCDRCGTEEETTSARTFLPTLNSSKERIHWCPKCSREYDEFYSQLYGKLPKETHYDRLRRDDVTS